MNEAHLHFCGGRDWQQMVEELVMPAALGDLELGADVIEIGPGPGFTTDVLRTRVAHLTAVEIDPDLAEALRTRLSGTNVEVVRGDATSLDFPDGRFTGAVSLNMLHHIPTVAAQDAALAELARVLRTGGRLVAADAMPQNRLDAFHEGDTYNPIDATELPTRFEAAGFTALELGEYDLGWTCTAVAG